MKANDIIASNMDITVGKNDRVDRKNWVVANDNKDNGRTTLAETYKIC